MLSLKAQHHLWDVSRPKFKVGDVVEVEPNEYSGLSGDETQSLEDASMEAIVLEIETEIADEVLYIVKFNNITAVFTESELTLIRRPNAIT